MSLYISCRSGCSDVSSVFLISCTSCACSVTSSRRSASFCSSLGNRKLSSGWLASRWSPSTWTMLSCSCSTKGASTRPGRSEGKGNQGCDKQGISVPHALFQYKEVFLSTQYQLPPQQMMAATKRAKSLSSSSRELKRVANWNLGSIMSLNGRRRLLRNSRVIKPAPRATRTPSLFMQEARRVKRAS